MNLFLTKPTKYLMYIASCSTNSVTCFMLNQCVGVRFLRASDSFGVGSGPIFLDRVNCMSGDTKVLNCVPRSIQGLPECNHDRDVGVHCEGMSISLWNAMFKIVQMHL